MLQYFNVLQVLSSVIFHFYITLAVSSKKIVLHHNYRWDFYFISMLFYLITRVTRN